MLVRVFWNGIGTMFKLTSTLGATLALTSIASALPISNGTSNGTAPTSTVFASLNGKVRLSCI